MADRVAVMRDGRVIQVGTPQQLYHRPESLFVADFLGEANFLPGRIVSGGGTALAVDTAAGRVVAEGSDEGPDGSEITCCVRPERIELVGDSQTPGQANELAAEVLSSTFLGEIRQYVCGLRNSETTWRVTCLSAAQAPIQAGATVRVRFAAKDVVLLRG